MAVALLLGALCLLLQTRCCGCSPQPAGQGCLRWSTNGAVSCCEACLPGHRLVKKCGKLSSLCKPCEAGTYTLHPAKPSCDRCRQCVGALVQIEACTRTSDTVCGCKEGLACFDVHCTYCVDKCAEGQEPTNNGSCRPCPEGTFNDQKQHSCRPWSTKCPGPNQEIVAKGDAFSDIRCEDVSLTKWVVKPESTENAETAVLLSIIPITAIVVMISAVVVVAFLKRKKNPKKPITRPHSDDPQTLRSIAIECSFHEAEQEQGSSLDSLDTKDSAEQLIHHS